MQKEIASTMKQQEDIHLRSARAITNYFEANDDDIGHVEDFLIEDEIWTIRYIVVDRRNWWPTDSKVHVDLTRDAITNGLDYNESMPLDRDYEKRLHGHHRRSEYWHDQTSHLPNVRSQ
jgi:hypothetical protein